MATIANLRSDLSTWLSGLGYPVSAGGHRLEQYLAPGASRSVIRTVSGERVEVGSNLQINIATLDIEFSIRAATSSVADIETAMIVIDALLDDVADPASYYALASVRSTPVLELSFSDEISIEGDVSYLTVRIEIALEA